MNILKKISLSIGILVLFLISFKMMLALPFFQVKEKITTEQLKTFKIEDLKNFDGTDPNKPIYLAYEGKVYDVTAGKKFYQPGGVYHFITGKDATVELNFAGGGIIKRKYLVIGTIIK